MTISYLLQYFNATVVKLVDTRDSKSLSRKRVSVRVRSVVFGNTDDKKYIGYFKKTRD